MILSARKISKSYKTPQVVPVLSDISIDVHPGESVAICGRSGEGKTTLLHILGTLELPDGGEIYFGNKKATSSNSAQLRRTEIGFIFQSYNLLEDFTALENVLMPARIARKTPNPKKAIALLEEVGLVHRANFPVKLLSGGERQRVAIARAFCNDPTFLIADEPTGNLDRSYASAIGELLLNCTRRRNKSLLIATHDTQLASLCDRRFLLSEGTLSETH